MTGHFCSVRSMNGQHCALSGHTVLPPSGAEGAALLESRFFSLLRRLHTYRSRSSDDAGGLPRLLRRHPGIPVSVGHGECCVVNIWTPQCFCNRLLLGSHVQVVFKSLWSPAKQLCTNKDPKENENFSRKKIKIALCLQPPAEVPSWLPASSDALMEIRHVWSEKQKKWAVPGWCQYPMEASLPL